MMFWEIYQQGQIQAARSKASQAAAKADSVQDSLNRVADRIDSLGMICQAMWELLSESLPNAEERLKEKVTEIDLRDGKLDGRMNRVQRECTQCGRPLHQRHSRCLYCGNEMESENIFQK